MIQRIQSIWLFVAALMNALVFGVDLYRWEAMPAGAAAPLPLRVGDHYPSLILVVTMTVLPIITIFMFKQRKRQMAMSAMSLVATGAFITMTLNRVGHLQVPQATGSYWIGSVLPLVADVFLILAILAIRKDENLVKSMDRLR
jgi:hypothetical protein